MARRREDHALSKRCVNFYAGDYEKLQVFYPQRMGAAKIIRDIIHAHVRKIEERAAQKIPLLDPLDTEVEQS